MSDDCSSKTDPSRPARYHIRVKGHLGGQWADWFGGLTITLEDNGETLLTGSVADQAALHGLLKKVRDLGLPLVSVSLVEAGQASGEPRCARKVGMEATMKAIRFTQYGPPDVLRLVEVEKPTPTEKQVLVKVHAAGANPLDWHHLRGAPILVRLGDGFLKPKNPKLGADVAGRVEAVGRGVTEFKPGDEVFGVCSGAFAEYALAGEAKLALKPARVSFEAAAATPVAAFTALQGLRDAGRFQPGQTVLINGAAGGVGTFAVQMAKALGAAEVTGVCSTRNLELVRSIGADYAIDYTREDFTQNGRQYDLIYCAVGNRSVFDYRRALSPQGRCVITGFTSLPRMAGQMVLGPRVSRAGGQTIAGQGIATTPKEDLLAIREMLEAGKVVPVIDRCYPLSETAEAIRYLEQGHARGKVVVMVDHAGGT